MQNRRGDDVVEQSMPLSGAGDETRRQEAAAQGLESSVSSGDVAMRIFNSDCVMALRNTCPSSARELLQRPTSCDPLHVGYEVVHQMEELMVGAVSNATSVSYTVCGASLLVWHTATNLAVMRDLLSRVFFAHDSLWVADAASVCMGLSLVASGAYLGGVSDTSGRSITVVAAVAMSGAASMLLCMIPTYSSAGVFASFLMACCMCLAAAAVGAISVGAPVLLTEHWGSENGRARDRGLKTSRLMATPPLALAGALAVLWVLQYLLSAESMEQGGWRTGFLLNVGLSGIWIYRYHAHVDESPAFLALCRRLQGLPQITAAAATAAAAAAYGTTSSGGVALALVLPPSPLPFMRAHWGNLCNPRLRTRMLVLAGCLSVPAWTLYYVTHVYARTYMTAVLHVPQPVADACTLSVALLVAPLTLVGGHLSDKIGRRLCLLSGLFMSAVLLKPSFVLLRWVAGHTGEAGTAVGLTTVMSLTLVVPLGLVVGPWAAYATELFSVKHRAGCIGLAHCMGVAAVALLLPAAIAALDQAAMGSGEEEEGTEMEQSSHTHAHRSHQEGLWAPTALMLVCGAAGFFLLPETRATNVCTLVGHDE